MCPEIGGGKGIADSDKHGALDQVLELADIARIRQRLEKIHSIGCDCRRSLAVGLAMQSGKMLYKQRYIVGSFAQWRQGDSYQIDAVEKVLAEGLCRHHCGQVGICGTNGAYIAVEWFRITKHLVGMLLQYPQQLDLTIEVELADFIEEYRAAVGNGKTPLAVGYSPGKSSLTVAEHLALEQRRRNAAEVHFDHLLILALRISVYRLGYELLAGAVLAHDKHRGIGSGDTANSIEYIEQCR